MKIEDNLVGIVAIVGICAWFSTCTYMRFDVQREEEKTKRIECTTKARCDSLIWHATHINEQNAIINAINAGNFDSLTAILNENYVLLPKHMPEKWVLEDEQNKRKFD